MLQQVAEPAKQSAKSSPGRGQSDQSQQTSQHNVSSTERIVSVASGAILAPLALSRRGWAGLAIGAVAGGLIYRGLSGSCSLYSKLGIDTAKDEATHQGSIHVEQAFLIERSPEDLYKYWRNFENLPSIMSHLKSVRVSDDRHSHWVATAPRIAGGSIEWDAEMTSDEPNERIAWRSVEGSAIDCTGEIRFRATKDRGTEVHVYMDYTPPAGRLGHWMATLFGESPVRQMRDDLRNFKSLMECGEILTTKGQPRGSCTGGGNGKHSRA